MGFGFGTNASSNIDILNMEYNTMGDRVSFVFSVAEWCLAERILWFNYYPIPIEFGS